MRTCRRCSRELPPQAFSWHDANHKYRDAYCKACRCRLKKERYVPKHTVRVHSFANKHGTVYSDALYAHLSEIECAYIAGLIDGEGCITSSQPRNNSAPLSIKITMVHRPTIEWLDEKVGGNLMYHRTNQKPARASWCLELKGARTFFLLKRLFPYLHTKQEEADIALELGESLFTPLVRGKITDIVRERRAFLGQQLRDAKRREWKP